MKMYISTFKTAVILYIYFKPIYELHYQCQRYKAIYSIQLIKSLSTSFQLILKIIQYNTTIHNTSTCTLEYGIQLGFSKF